MFSRLFRLPVRILTFLLFSPLTSAPIPLEELSLEQKVGQLLMVDFEGRTAAPQGERLIKEAFVGGLIYYAWANGLSDPDQIRKLSLELQSLAREHSVYPLLIAIDQEGGCTTRLKEGFTIFPGNAPLGAAGEPRLAYESARAMGVELACVGINVNLAPVLDVNSNPINPVIGVRSFGSDPELVLRLGRSAVSGCEAAGVIPCLKHFPGHGDVSIDSHKALPVAAKSRRDLLQDLLPFSALAKSAPAIMTAHVLYPAFDDKRCATLSPTILHALLRDELGFQGVLITDSLTMQGVRGGRANLEEVALEAFEAGNDILLIAGRNLNASSSDEIIHLHRALVNAVRSGKIQEERLNASVARILALKERAGLKPEATFREEEHLRLAKEIAYRSVHPVKGSFPMALSDRRVLVVAPSVIASEVSSTSLCRLGREATLITFNEAAPSASEMAKAAEQARHHDVILFCSYNAWKSKGQLELLNALSATKPTLCIATHDPQDIDGCPKLSAALVTYSPTPCSLETAAEWIEGRLSPLPLSEAEAQVIGRAIWRNECASRTDQLTYWNAGEAFPSMGIGHFIWPPEDYSGPFAEGRFHKVVTFLQDAGASVPPWLLAARYCPWKDRSSFYEQISSEKMRELQAFLEETIPLQALYMAERLGQAFMEMVCAAPLEERLHLMRQFFRLSESVNGPYILIDYLNWKHEGTDRSERYEGLGWGLLQVLLAMGQTQGSRPEDDFAECAERLLRRRVSHAPRSEIEARWLPGWLARLETYRSGSCKIQAQP